MGGRLLLVEDDRESREALAALLELEGFYVLTATSVSEALETLHTHEGVVRCIVSDTNLEGPECGHELFQQLGASGWACRFIAVSGEWGRNGDARAVYESCGVPMLTKPVNIEELLQLVAHAFAPLP